MKKDEKDESYPVFSSFLSMRTNKKKSVYESSHTVLLFIIF